MSLAQQVLPFRCQRCGAFCKSLVGRRFGMILTPLEMRRLSGYARRHRIKFDVAPLTRNLVGAVTLYQVTQDRCPFLEESRRGVRCKCYALRPTVCRMFPIHPFAVFRCDNLEAQKRRFPGVPLGVPPEMKEAADFFAREIQPVVEDSVWVYNLNTGWEPRRRQRPLQQVIGGRRF